MHFLEFYGTFVYLKQINGVSILHSDFGKRVAFGGFIQIGDLVLSGRSGCNPEGEKNWFLMPYLLIANKLLFNNSIIVYVQ